MTGKETQSALCGACGRRGYTLVEMLVASTITMMVLSQIALALVASQRLCESTVADIELSLQSRALREKLLYSINEDGGLMNAGQTDVALVNGNKNKGTGIIFTPKKGRKNKLQLSDSKKLVADLPKSAKWLECGTMMVQGTNVFGLYTTNGTIEVTLDVAIPISTRKYVQRNLAKAQIMNK